MAPVRGSIVCVVNDGCDGIGGLVLENRDLPCLAPAERRDREIGLAVAVEVGGLDVGDARPAVEPERAELAVAEAAQPDDGALVVIGGKELAEIGDEQILRRRRRRRRSARRARDAECWRRSRARRLDPAGCAAEDDALPHVGAEQRRACLSPSKSTSWTFDTAGVSGMSGSVRLCLREAHRRFARIRPRLGRRQMVGRMAGVERQHLRHVRRQLHRRYAMSGGPIGGSRFSRMNIIRTNSSRQASRGRMSGGGNAWHVAADRSRLLLI